MGNTHANAFRRAQENRTRKQTCRVGDIILALDATDQQRSADLAEALSDPGISNATIQAVLRAWEQPVAQSTVGIHRNGDCVCARDGGDNDQ